MKRTDSGVIFETKRLVVRLYDSNDGEFFFALNGNEEVMQYIRPVKTREESDQFLLENIAYSADNPFMGRWAVDEKDSGNFVGSFAIIPIPGDEEKIQLGYSLLPRYWGKGFASELTIAGLNYFFTQTSLLEIYGVTETPNIASQKVLLKAGFQPVGNKMEEEKELLLFVLKRHF
jgi:[ribosomal protein S5]-alanine N-acetyltransferase